MPCRTSAGRRGGCSKEEVKFSEHLAPLNEGEGFIAFREHVMGLDAVVGFHFMENTLVEAGYAFRESLEGEHLYLKVNRKLKGMHTGSYGEPSYNEGAYGEYGCLCVRCSGEECLDSCPLIYLSEWTTGRSVIMLVLMGEENGFDFGLLYRSREHENLVGDGLRRGPGEAPDIGNSGLS